jgi:hypothetical protein
MKVKPVILGLVIAAGLLVPACFFPDNPVAPRSDSRLTLCFSRSTVPTSPGRLKGQAAQLSQLLADVDSVAVKVFHAGVSRRLESTKGLTVPPATDTVRVSLAVSPEKHKRVAVELYEAGKLIYFGVDEDVDVFLNQETAVMIDAFAFGLAGLDVSGAYITDGTTFTLRWHRVPSATAYHIQESPTSDFSTISYELTLTDTTVTFSRSEGPYFYRAAPLNQYCFGTYCPSKLVFVYGAPVISAVAPAAAARRDTITVRGQGLDYPGNKLYIGGLPCQVTSAGPMEIEAVVPLEAVTDTIYVTGTLGTSQTAGPYRIQLVAYVAATDLTTALQYQQLIQADGPYPPYLLNSGVKVLSLSDLDGADMSVYVVIIIGPDTGDDAGWGEGVAERVAAIIDGQAQLIGLGQGGNAFYREANLFIGRQPTARDMGRSAAVLDPADPIYNWPVQFVPGDDLQLYKVDVPRLSTQMDMGTQPSGLSLYANLAKDSDLYLLLNQSESGAGSIYNNFFWGFEAGPANMTGQGQLCFMNSLAILFDASSKIVVPLPPAP